MTAIAVDDHGSVRQLTLNRPDAGNAIDMALAEQFAAVAEQAAADPSVRCVVVTGSGRMFCVGGDIGLFAAGDPAEVLRDLATAFHRGLMALATMAKPLVVLVNGPAAGAGLSLLLHGDIVLAARSAHFTAAYTAIGLSPDGGMTWTLPRLVGSRLAQEMILTNRRLTADEAASAGMITRVVDDDKLQSAGLELAAKLAAGPVAAFGAARALLRLSSTTTLENQLAAEATSISNAGAGAECAEGLAAFLQKRRPVFTTD